MKNTNTVSDRIGIISSAVCLVHCLTFPVLVLLRIPLSEGFHEHWHVPDYIFLGVSFFAVYFSARSSARHWVKYFLWTSFFALAASILLKHYETVFETIAIAAAVFLIAAHVLNIRRTACAMK